MAESKQAPSTPRPQKSAGEVETDNRKQTAGAGDTSSTPGTVEPLQSDANPEGKEDVSTGPVGDEQVIDAQEHVLGDDPRRVAHKSGGFHDSLTGRPVDESGNFQDLTIAGSEGPVPSHRIVANNWPQEREQINDPTKRVGNKA